jgi:hypothetical protein
MRMRTLSHVPWPHLAVLLFVAALVAFVVNGGLDTPEPVTTSSPLPAVASALPTLAPPAPRAVAVPSGIIEVVVSAVVQPHPAMKSPPAKATPVSPSRPRSFRLLRRH